MDWLRRNWPDMLIGIALVAVIAGIIATLITGGSFFTIGQPERPSPQVSTPLPNAATPVVVPGAPPPQVEGSPTPTDGTEPDAAGPTVAVLPPSGGTPAPAAPEAEPPAAPTPEVIPPTTGTPEPAAPEPVAPTPVVSAPVEVSPPVPSDDGEAPFRVSVGAFSTAENAERQAQIFRDAGFPVLIGSQGDLSLVLVGPFDTRAEAEVAATRVLDAGLFDDPLIYTFKPEDETPLAPVAAAPAAASSTPEPTPAASGRYLQVGAYGSADSAEPQRQRLASLGFSVTDRIEGGLVKLLIGPFEAAELSAAQSRLESAGIENFPR